MFFGSLGNLRGLKGSLYEGGIRVPLIAPLAGHDQGRDDERHAAATSRTCCRRSASSAGTTAPKGLDGISFCPTLSGAEAEDARLPVLGVPGLRRPAGGAGGDWKAVRQNLAKGPAGFELYDLDADPSEAKNVAAKHPEVVKRLEAIAKERHTPSGLFPLPSVDLRPKKK